MSSLLLYRNQLKQSLITKKDFPIYIPSLQQIKKAGKVLYKDDVHSYTNLNKGNRMKGVTSFIGSLTPSIVDYPTQSTQLRLGLTNF